MRATRSTVRAAAATAVLGAALLAGAGPAGADAATQLSTFTAMAQAPLFQMTEDEPTANFHPEGEGELVHSLATLDNTSGYALAAPFWPGPAAANAGSLAILLGAPPQVGFVKDPVRAEATSAGPTQSSVDTPTSKMDASASSNAASSETTVAAAGDPSVVDFTSADSRSNITVNTAGTAVTSKASGTAHDITVAGGLVKIGGVVSSAEATTGQKPSGATTFSDVTIAGQRAWIDGSGIHIGSPGALANPLTTDQVNKALAGAGMEMFLVRPHTIVEGQKSQYYAGALVFYWYPPDNNHYNSFTLTVGGASVAVGAGTGGSGLGLSVGGASPSLPGPTGGGDIAAALPPASSLPAAAAAALGVPAAPAPTSQAGAGVPSSFTGPLGIGAGWILLIVLAAAVGAVALPRLPTLLSAASAAACERERRGEP
ncbi:MAG TPA: hypothetical protein VFA11_04675 [Acidimicrobiales bacterium]|nr:hypothetical protein [Acidimicrobiales bacterium]